MTPFIQQHSENVMGVLKGFDRMLFRGTLRRVSSAEGMRSYLAYIGVLLKDFKTYSLSVTEQLRRACEEAPGYADRPNLYLSSSGIRKGELAEEIAKRDQIATGPICLFRSVEPCWSFEIRRNREKQRLELVPALRKCLHLYHYERHPEFGLMHSRLQTWYPFTMKVCLNGREWLGRALDKAGLGYQRRENCFVWLEDIDQAQALMAEQLRVNWPQVLEGLREKLSPAHEAVFSAYPLAYYWSVEQSEWATDLMFKNATTLSACYEQLIHHGMQHLGSREVMRFLGRRVPLQGGVHGHFKGESVSDLRQRPEGVRIKHRVNQNSIKMYDKQGSVLRIETTINNPRDFKVFRRPEGASQDTRQAWLKLRKGVADMHRRAMVSEAANERYLDALAVVGDNEKLTHVLKQVCQPATWKGSRARALRPFHAQDMGLLQQVSRGEYSINGFRNRDLCNALFKDIPSEGKEKRKRSASVTRQLRLLRAHGIITKVPHTYRYVLTTKGRQVITALMAAEQANINQLQRLAA